MSEKTKSESGSNDDIAFRNESIKAITGLIHENKKLRDTIAEKAKERKTSRQEAASNRAKTRSESMRLRGLQGFTGQLGS
jgi:DNA gyrase/topoisomerase IV subunit B